jgi:hypothetical protein
MGTACESALRGSGSDLEENAFTECANVAIREGVNTAITEGANNRYGSTNHSLCTHKCVTVVPKTTK